jgi:hypothetical protein
MSSSSTDDPRPFLSADRGSVLRLVVVIALGIAALVGPLVASTSARFTEQQEVGVVISVPPTPTSSATP